jgi:hypothetical protein
MTKQPRHHGWVISALFFTPAAAISSQEVARQRWSVPWAFMEPMTLPREEKTVFE